jgi:hypothetical protein
MARASVEERPDVAARVLGRSIQSSRKATAGLSRFRNKSFSAFWGRAIHSLITSFLIAGDISFATVCLP